MSVDLVLIIRKRTLYDTILCSLTTSTPIQYTYYICFQDETNVDLII